MLILSTAMTVTVTASDNSTVSNASVTVSGSTAVSGAFAAVSGNNTVSADRSVSGNTEIFINAETASGNTAAVSENAAAASPVKGYMASKKAVSSNRITVDFKPDKVVSDVKVVKNIFEDGTVNYTADITASKPVLGTALIEAVKSSVSGENVLLTVSTRKKDGKIQNRFSLNTKQAENGNSFRVFEVDDENGDLILSSVKDVELKPEKGIKFKGKSGNYVLVEVTEAEKLSEAIEESVVLSGKYVQLNAGEKRTIGFSKDTNLLNIVKVSYKSDNNKTISVDKNGVITACAGGSASVKVKVKLANKKTIELSMAVKVNE